MGERAVFQTGLVQTGMDWSRLVLIGLVQLISMFEEAILFKLDWYRLVQIGLVWIGSDWFELVQLITMFEEAGIFQIGLVQIGSDGFRLDWYGLVQISMDWLVTMGQLL